MRNKEFHISPILTAIFTFLIIAMLALKSFRDDAVLQLMQQQNENLETIVKNQQKLLENQQKLLEIQQKN